MRSRRDFFRQGFALGLGTLLLPPKLILPHGAEKKVILTPEGDKAIRLNGETTSVEIIYNYQDLSSWDNPFIHGGINGREVRVSHIEHLGEKMPFDYFNEIDRGKSVTVAFSARKTYGPGKILSVIGDFYLISYTIESDYFGRMAIISEWLATGPVEITQ